VRTRYHWNVGSATIPDLDASPALAWGNIAQLNATPKEGGERTRISRLRLWLLFARCRAFASSRLWLKRVSRIRREILCGFQPVAYRDVQIAGPHRVYGSPILLCDTDLDRIRCLFSPPSMVVASRCTHLQALTLLKLGFLTTLSIGSKYKSLSVAANETGVPEQSIPC
jgi:hypothetical protein